MKVTAVHGSREWEPRQGGGTNVDFTVETDKLEGRHTLTQKKDGPHQAPKPGDTLFGHAEDGGRWPSGDPRPPKIKRDQVPDGEGAQEAPSAPQVPPDPALTRPGKDPHSRSIEGQVALKAAAMAAQGKSPEEVVAMFYAVDNALQDRV